MRSPSAWRSSASVMRRCRASAAISTTSSTPASAASSRTCSITSWRTSGPRMGGSGSDTSSKAMVSAMPGRSWDRSGSASPNGSSRARRMALTGSARASTGSGAYRTRLPTGSFSSRYPSPCQNKVEGVERSTSRTKPGLGLMGRVLSCWGACPGGGPGRAGRRRLSPRPGVRPRRRGRAPPRSGRAGSGPTPGGRGPWPPPPPWPRRRCGATGRPTSSVP